MKETFSYDRYHRQLILKNFGEEAQQKLFLAKVLVIGAGGLGCPALQYLAAAGVGVLGIVDDDRVSLSNLHRQVLYTVTDIGSMKVERAAEALRKLNPEISIIAYIDRLTNKNAFSILKDFDIIIDGTDNFSSRYMINDACVLLNKPLVYGSISQYEGQVAIFNTRNNEARAAVNYRDLFPHPPRPNEVLNCAEAGVLGVLSGIIGTMQANETIKLLTGIGEPLVNRLLTYSALTNKIYELELAARDDTASLIPAHKEAFESMDYDWLCNTGMDQYEIDHNFFDNLLEMGDLDVVDVREPGEVPVIKEFAFHQIPLSKLHENLQAIQSGTVVAICQSGNRSLQAAKQLVTLFGGSKRIYSLRGGITGWKQNHAKQLL